MKSFISKNILGGVAGPIILIGILFMANFFYFNYRLNTLRSEIDAQSADFAKSETTLNDKIVTLGGVVESTLTEGEKQKEELRDALGKITNTVKTLERVAVTDRDLLKKYSKTYFLNENYSPLDLEQIPSKWRNSSSSSYQILSDVEPYLEDLFEAADRADLGLLAQSAYRSFGTQSQLKTAYIVTYGAGTANRFSADQGYSEHQLGTTLDFTTKNTAGNLEGFETTPEYAWLEKNAYKYGFILSYPPNNAFYKFEPWHWRFVGKELAEKLHDEDMYFYDMDQRVIDSYLAEIFD